MSFEGGLSVLSLTTEGRLERQEESPLVGGPSVPQTQASHLRQFTEPALNKLLAVQANVRFSREGQCITTKLRTAFQLGRMNAMIDAGISLAVIALCIPLLLYWMWRSRGC